MEEKKERYVAMNHVTIIGNLTRDPVVKDGEYGKLCFFTVAVSRRDGKQSDFFSVRTTKKQAEACEKYLAKGRPVAVSGSVHLDSFGAEGNKRYVLSLNAEHVEFLSSKGGAKPETELPDVGYTDVSDDEELPW